MSDDRRVAVPLKLLPATVVAIDAQCDRLFLGREKAIALLIEHALPWLESLPDALRPPS